MSNNNNKSTKKDFRYTAPKSTQDRVHRNPAHVAKDAQDMYGGVNPLVCRLYGDGTTGGNDLSVPGRLTSLNPHTQSTMAATGAGGADEATYASSAPPSRGAEPHPPADFTASAGASRGNTTFVNSLQVFQQPSYQDDDLKRIFTTSSQQGAMSMPKKRPTPPAKLQPLSTTKTDAAEPAAETSLAASKIPRFVKTSSNSPNEFAYMVMRPRGIRDRFNPYDLQVVTHKDLDPNHYFTVSASGVTQFVNGTAEFIELPTWERECKVFDRLSELPIFRDYKKWRSFLLWRALVRRQAMTKCSNFLTNNLLYIHPNLSGTLQAVRKICLEFVATNNLYVAASETRTLDGYCTVLRQHLDKERGRIEKMIKTIREKVEQACKAAMVTAQMEREANKLHKDDEAARKKKKVVDMRELGTMQQPSYIEVAQRKATCKRLTAFIKLCDYLVITCLTKLADKAVESMQEDLQYPKTEKTVGGAAAHDAKEKEKEKEKNPKKKEEIAFNGALLSVEVQFNEEESLIEITPSHDLVLENVEDMIRDYVRTVGGVPRLVSMDTFKVYTDQAQDSMSEATGGPEVAEMVVSEQHYKDNITKIRDHLAGAFEDVERYVDTFDPFREMYVENSALNTEDILNDKQTLDFFRSRLTLYKGQMESISSKIPDFKVVGLVQVYTESFREFMTPSPVTCLEGFHSILPLIAHRENEALLEELQKQTTYLAVAPKTVEHYVEYLEFYRKLEAKLDDISATFDFTRDLFNLLQEEKIVVNEDDLDTFRSGTRPQFDKLRTLMQMTEDGKETQQRLFARNIDEQMDQLRHSIEEVYDKAGQPIVSDENANVDDVIAYITGLQKDAEAIAEREKDLRRYQLSIGAEETTVDTMADMLNDVNMKSRLWVSVRDWEAFTEETRQQPIETLSVTSIQDTVQQYTTLAKQVSTKLPNNAMVPKLKSRVEEWRMLTPILQAIRNPKLKSEHTAKMSQIIGPVEAADGTSKSMSEWGAQLTVGLLLDNNVVQYREELLAVSAAAVEEDKLQQQIDKVGAMWTGGGPKPPMEFQFHNHKDIKDVYTLVGGSVEDTLALLDDSLIAISTIASSKFCQGVLKAQTERWDSRLKYMQETLDAWVELQRNWIYLENIFSSSEIRSQWKEDAKRFEKVDRFFRDLMRKAHDQPTAYRALLINAPSFELGEAAATKSLKIDLDVNIKELERVLFSLEKKLEEKRRSFPRFYFLSNDDLLDILAKVKTPELMMPHMLKMFDGIKSLTFGDGNDITHLLSMEGEKVELVNKNVKARGPVDSWMDMLEREMMTTLRKHAQTCLEDFEERGDRSKWMFQHPVQLVLIMEQLLWTRGVEEALDKPNSAELMTQLKDVNYRNLDELAGLTGCELSKVQRVLLSTMITIDVHGRDLVDEMCENNVVETKDFGWQKQLRAYWEKDEDGYGNIFIRQNNSRFVYGYEYLGAQGRLVITPLTDRIYMTITGALKLYLGASPSGPAGTGKTETVKDLAKNLARQCIVYNCSDGVTYKMMEKFFSGLIQTGAWACLDEFNRINIEVLSVIASQILEIKLALQNEVETFTFQGTPDVRVRATYGSFVTMNPGYAGRTELPDNLKILFRPVAVMTPDFRMIAEVILYSEGFKNAKDLSLKITQLYKLSSEQLSPQDHYDFGMRALKSILVMAGDLKRSQPDVPEDLTLIVACNDSNVPKFVSEDVPLFHGIMQDLFPGVAFPERSYDELLPAIQSAMAERKLVDAGAWVQKSIQYYETLIVRHGVMLVGATGTGKSEIRECIARSLTSMSAAGSSNPTAKPVHQFVMNPKAVLLHELYGQLDVNTNEWKDGVLAAIAKMCVRDSEGSKDHRWIVFDGPVDTLWIESLNSVLDDSKLLCLDSGERIKLPETIHLLFEVADLSVASPATVSRCGMVYVDVTDLPWIAVVRQWSETKLAASGMQPRCREYVISLFEAYAAHGLEWLGHQKRLMHAGQINVIQSLCDLFTALIKVNKLTFMADLADESGPDDSRLRERNELCNVLFVFSFIWSVGSNVDQAGMDSFDTMARTLLETLVRLPNGGSVYDYTIEYKSRLFVPWEAQVKPFSYKADMPFFNILVPTVDTVRYSFLAKTLIDYGKPILFSGQTGVGKSVILSDCLNSNKDEMQLALVMFQFSAQTSSERTQMLIESKLKQKRKNIMGAPPGKRVALFIDDLNMPALEVFGASPPIELIRQLMGSGGFYDRKVAGFWKFVEDTTYVAACGPPEGGRNPVTPRLLRLFHLFQIPNLTNDSMKRIFDSILGGFLESKNFNKEVRGLSTSLVTATVEVFNRLQEDLRPRPTTPHYTFNLRDLAKVFQGMTQAVPRVCRDARSMTRLWVHECMRCFYDRLSTAEDRTYFTDELVMDALTRCLHGTHNHDELFGGEPLIWGDFLRFGAAEHIYEEAPDLQRIAAVLDEYQEDYNATATTVKPGETTAAPPLNLVFFKDHCAHLARIIRVVRQPRGNALLVGVGGSGKRSLTRLASYVAGCRVFEITVGKGYSMNEFHEFLLEVYTYAGVQNKACVFSLSDNQIVHEAMLEDVNNILNSGEVPSLFSPEEREKRVSACMEAAQQEGITNRDDVYNFFISRVRDNMHIVLCMSPVGDTFRTRCRQFPSLTNCCSIDWFDEWPSEALEGVAARLLHNLGGAVSAEFVAKLPVLCVDVHTSVVRLANDYWEELRRRYYITPTSYLEFIDMYESMLGSRRVLLEEQLSQVENGKEKMIETDKTIATMRKEIEEKRPLLEKASQETETVVADLTVRQAKAAEVQVQVKAQQESAAIQQKEASKIASEANSRLAEAKPIIERAKAALDTIQASDLNELRSFANPPSAVLKTTQACMVMFDPKDFNGQWSGSMDWKGAREFLSHRPLLDMIRNYPTENVKPAVLQKVQKFITDDEFTVEICSQKGSQTCGSLCAWVHAVNEYSKVVKEVAPMRQAAAEAEAHLAETNAKLQAAQQQLKEVEAELTELQANYEVSLKKKNDLEAGLATCISRLENAQILSDSLKSEGTRWTENIEKLRAQLQALPMQTFFASACAVYMGPFTPVFRKRLMTLWSDQFAAHGYPLQSPSLVDILGDPVDTLNWQVNGLPTDNTSTENAIIATMSNAPRRWPLFIDPQEQGLKWLLKQYQPPAPVGAAAAAAGAGAGGGKASSKAASGPTAKVIKFTEGNWMRTLESQVRLGGVVIIDDVGETLDPALEPLISRRIVASDGGAPQIQLTPQSGPIDYNPNFRLFICTKLPNPHYLPDVSTRLALLNFTVTLEGLEDQMLGEVVSIEKKDLEEEKNAIIQSIALGQKKLKAIEEQILERLKFTKGNILDDRGLITELQSAQSNAKTLGENQVAANQKMEIISASRESYRIVAVRAALLFFVLADVARIDPMYQYSLQFFINLVRQRVERTAKPEGFDEKNKDMLQEHLQRVITNVTESTYTQICRGLFNKDKLILSLLMSTSIARHSGEIKEEEWQYFVRASALVSSEPVAQPVVLPWLSRLQWELAEALSRTVPAMHELVDKMQGATDAWRDYVNNALAAEDKPANWEKPLTPFQHILLVRCFREEKLYLAVADYVRETMGPHFMDPPPFDLSSALRDSTPGTPIIFVLSQGADPMDALQAFAQSENRELQYVSLGQGQGANAKKLIATCRASGAWALLQNCHLSKSFMPDLMVEVASLQNPNEETHPDFRLWLTSMPTDFFPIFVLQTGIKITNEPPTGLRANMVRCFNDLTPADYDAFPPTAMIGESNKSDTFKKLLYGLCFFHAIILERKKFGPLGWNVKYEWNDTDFHVSKQWLRLFFEEQDTIPWESLEYIIGQINYGGRVTDPQDRGTLQTILHNYMCPALLEPDYTFAQSEGYDAPPTGTLEEAKQQIARMSTVDSPEVFGMHDNANIRFQLQTSQYVLQTVISVQPRLMSSTTGGMSPEEEVRQKCKDFEESLPANILREEAGPTSFTTLPNGLPNSMSTVLTHELVKYNKLLTRIRTTLSDMQKALQGLTVLSSDLDAMYGAFLSDQVPELWRSVSYASLMPLGAWYRDFLQRVHFIRTWVHKGEPSAFWMAGFFNPSAFMTGIYQAYARAEGVSVDKLSFQYEVIDMPADEIAVGPERGCYVYGIYTDAWRWDSEKRVMADCLPGQPYATLPVVHFLPQPNHKKPDNYHSVPMYRTVIRAGVISSLGASSNYVLSIEIPTEHGSDYWLLRGAACVCALER